MTFFQAILLGIIQGLTEFLPISSSAHLVLLPFLLNWELKNPEAFIFNVLVQLGTLVAVVVFFRKELISIIKAFFAGLKSKKPFSDYDSRTAWLIILATIPAGLVGLLLKDKVEAAFSNPVLVAALLLVNAFFMAISEFYGKQTRDAQSNNAKDALVIGLFQAFAIFPGISRSGVTISTGLLLQHQRKAAARFSFLMSIPIMLAASLLAGKSMLSLPNLVSFLPVMVIGFFVAGVVGYISIAWLMRFIGKQSLFAFSIYCFVLAITVFIVNYVY